MKTLEKLKMKFIKKQSYMDWDEYESMINTIDVLCWQQHVRRITLKNMKNDLYN